MTDHRERYRQMCELAACVYTDEELAMAPGINWSMTIDEAVKRGAHLLKNPSELKYVFQDSWDTWYERWSPQIEEFLEEHNDSPNT